MEVLAFQAGQLSLEHDLVLVFIDVYAGTPRTGGNPFVIEGASHITGEKTVDFVLQGSQIAKRVVTTNTHSQNPPDFLFALSPRKATVPTRPTMSMPR